jgi:large-conductance mechanosensitive channel
VLILKELLIRAKKVTLAVNIVVGIAAIAYVPVYISALLLPMI